MKKLDLQSFLNAIDYDWQNDQEDIKKICYYTKSRVNSHKKEFELSYGMEQTFFLKALAQWNKCESFLEIGTGRGTACYAVSLLDEIKFIDTIDIIPFDHKRQEAIGYEPAYVSNKDLYELIPFLEKEKISFHERKHVGNIIQSKKMFDLIFIDGNHDDKRVVYEDFEISRLMQKENTLIVWDDYYPDKFAIKDVVHKVEASYPEYDLLLIETRGHLFGTKSPEKDCGMVLMKKGKFDENIFA